MIWWILSILAVLFLLFLLNFKRLWRYAESVEANHAHRLFHAKQDLLEQQFLAEAAQSGVPKDLVWKELEWDNSLEFVRHLQTGEIAALKGVTIHFDAVEGSEMDGWHAVGMPRNATAVFFFQKGEWHTSGKAIFNKNPDEAAEHFSGHYVRIDINKNGE